MRAGRARVRLRPSLRSGRLGTGLALAWIALLAHLLQVGHFLGVAHEVGPDGQLRHATSAADPGCHAEGRCAGDPARHPSKPSPSDDDEGGDRCPIAPPGLEPCAGPALHWLGPVPIDDAVVTPRPPIDPCEDDVLAFAPKHSPPSSRQS